MTGCYETSGENCIPHDEQHTTHKWQNIKHKCIDWVYISKNYKGLQSYMKKWNDKNFDGGNNTKFSANPYYIDQINQSGDNILLDQFNFELSWSLGREGSGGPVRS